MIFGYFGMNVSLKGNYDSYFLFSTRLGDYGVDTFT